MTVSIRKSALLSVAASALAPAAFFATATTVTPLYAQDYTSGAIAGTIVDGSGNSVAGATVTVRSKSQGFERSTTTTSSGGYRFSGLPIGVYDITVDAPGNARVIQQDVRVAASSTATFDIAVGGTPSGGDEVVVSATRQSFDFANTTTGINIDVEDFVKEIPVGRDLTSLTLFAPGTAQGDNAFGNLPSLSGASVAENAYYLNGLNITNFDNGLGSALVPFEFYKSIEVKTGGYPAEFGRATGGIVNAVTKSGGNEFTAGVHINWSPDALRSDSPDTTFNRNGLDERESASAIVEFGGPIIEDHLFFYGIGEFRDSTSRDVSKVTGVQVEDKDNDPFFGFKLDGYVTSDHHFEFTYFDTDRTIDRATFSYDGATDTVDRSAVNSRTIFDNGGASYVAKYTGTLAPWLTISGAYGQSDDKFIARSESPLNRVLDLRSGTAIDLSTQTTTTNEIPYNTNREFWRADADIFFNLFGDHHARLGYDRENLNLAHVAVRTGPAVNFPTPFPGGLLYIYRTCAAPSASSAPDSRTAACRGDALGLNPGDEYVELNYFNSGGVFDAKNTAFYAQDEWNVTNRLTLNLGVRLDKFANFTGNGSQFIDFDSEIAPRVGFSYDLLGDGTSRFYGSFGHYFLPVASNTAFRQGAQEFFFREYWTFTGIGNNGVPIFGAQNSGFLGATDCPFGLQSDGGPGLASACSVTGRGAVQDPTASISRNLKATKEREIIVGYEQKLGDLWTVGVSYTRRDLRSNAEDVALDRAINAWCDDPANGVDQSTTDCSSIWTGFTQYTIVNPGVDSVVTLKFPLPGETEQRTITLTADQLGFPKPVRKLDQIQFTFNREFDGKWSLAGNYTWMNSRGNSEGYVKSDVGQDDAGITQDFDILGLTDGSFGKLPNHRAHSFKMWGSYQVTDALSLGANGSLTSPRKFGCLGVHPTDVLAQAYGASSYYCDLDADGTQELTPRGTVFESDWVKNVDLSVRYRLELPTGTGATLRADVFNVFNFDGSTDHDEFGETGGGDVNPTFGEALSFQAPRSVRLGLDLAF